MTRKKSKRRAAGNKDDRSDWSRFSKFKEENEKLKKEVSKLRKLAKDAMIDKLENKQRRVDNDEPAIEPLCERCGNPDIKTVNIPRADGKFELVVCKSCNHRSTLKRVK